MDQHLDDFITYIRAERGLSPHTVEAYQRDGLAFFTFLKSHGIEEMGTVRQETIIDYLAQLQEQQYAPASIARNFITLKVLFRFLKREGILEHNPAFYLDTPKLWQLLPETLSQEEVERLLSQPDRNHPQGARDAAILELLYASGLRASELCRIRIRDIDQGTVRVFGKGGKERLVPVGEPALLAVEHYLKNYRSEEWDKKEAFLFVSRKGRTIDRIGVWKIIKNYIKKAGISKRISPHSLRHTFATHLLNHGAELRVIQEMLGHASIHSTDRYTHVSKTHLQEAFYAFHPKN